MFVDIDFAAASSLLRVYGEPASTNTPRVEAGVLQLTSAEFFQTGAAVINVTGVSGVEEFSAEFDLYMGGGGGGEGVSFNIGDLPDTFFDERGAVRPMPSSPAAERRAAGLRRGGGRGP